MKNKIRKLKYWQIGFIVGILIFIPVGYIGYNSCMNDIMKISGSSEECMVAGLFFFIACPPSIIFIKIFALISNGLGLDYSYSPINELIIMLISVFISYSLIGLLIGLYFDKKIKLKDNYAKSTKN